MDKLELDLMEYATDADAQAAYVSNGLENKFLSLETNNDTRAYGNDNYDEKRTACKLVLAADTLITAVATYFEAHAGPLDQQVTVCIETVVDDKPSGTLANVNLTKAFTVTEDAWNLVTFAVPAVLTAGSYAIVFRAPALVYNRHLLTRVQTSNATAPLSASTNGGTSWTTFTTLVSLNIRVYTASLLTASENTIKKQGSYALKATASITSSLNKTLTKTFSPVLDLSRVTNLNLDIYASRAGANIKIGLHDTGDTTTEITPTITTVNTWQRVNFSLAAVADANKNAIDKLIITIVNADAANIFYLDYFEIAQAGNLIGVMI
jgi:hypothetical protein